MNKHTGQKVDAPAPGEQVTFWNEFKSILAEERRKGWLFRGLIRQSKSDRQERFMAEAKTAINEARNLSVKPTRVETFEAAVERQGLTEEFLNARMQQHKWVHLGLYLLSGALLVYAQWMFMSDNMVMSLGVLCASLGMAVNGYIHGFRAWQIENRNLIRFQDALRIPGTYLVL